jgi:hypothetical protein
VGSSAPSRIAQTCLDPIAKLRGLLYHGRLNVLSRSSNLINVGHLRSNSRTNRSAGRREGSSGLLMTMIDVMAVEMSGFTVGIE